jgi:hypothetical protein
MIAMHVADALAPLSHNVQRSAMVSRNAFTSTLAVPATDEFGGRGHFTGIHSATFPAGNISG